MKKIASLLLIVVSVISGFAQGVLDKDVAGFEGEKSSWWIQHKEIFSFNNDKVNEGDYSLKFSRSSETNVKGPAHIHNKKISSKTLRSGKYKITAKVWLAKRSPSGFSFNFNGGKWKSVRLDFSGLPKKKWVEVSNEFKLDASQSGEVILTVSEETQYGGYGSFYLDNLAIERIK